MRRFAITVAILGFLVLACVGLASDVPPLTAALRALGGAVAVYFVTRLASGAVLSIMVDAVLSAAPGQKDEETLP